ncbi:MAG: lamin tail domain-containing protein [Actinomycetes bacterium]
MPHRTRVARFRVRAFVLAAAVAASTGAVSLPLTQHARAASLQYWYGTLSSVDDGDTVYVDITGDGKGPLPIRNANIQATEMHGAGDRPECHAVDATNYMKAMMPHGAKVRLSSYYASSTAGTDPSTGVSRLLRYVDVMNSGGAWVDTQLRMIQHGLVMAGADAVENAHYQTYAVEMQKAMAAHYGLFDTNRCGVGPAAGAAVPIWIHYEADGPDGSAPNMEWMRMQNKSNFDVSLSGWHLRDSGHTWYHGTTYYTFPSYAHISPGHTITIYPGAGTNSASAGRYYLNVTQGAFYPNVADPTLASPGKQMYLLDPQLDFRGWAVYPCLYNCPHPPVHIQYVHYTTSDEFVDVVVDDGVTSGVDLSGVEVINDGWSRELDPGTILYPGELLRVYCQRAGTENRKQQYWHHSGPMFEDSGDTVVLRTDRSVVLSTYAWGTG